ncbi:hypothetical protein GUG24_02460, partial [Xanthomonas citri pv. citri]|nr:hypothetical protein [Xanthomonas citri pv. citri]
MDGHDSICAGCLDAVRRLACGLPCTRPAWRIANSERMRCRGHAMSACYVSAGRTEQGNVRRQNEDA